MILTLWVMRQKFWQIHPSLYEEKQFTSLHFIFLFDFKCQDYTIIQIGQDCVFFKFVNVNNELRSHASFEVVSNILPEVPIFCLKA